MKRIFITGGADFVGLVRIGNHNEYWMPELAEKVIDRANSISKLVSLPLLQDDSLQGKPLIALAKNELYRWSLMVEYNGRLTKLITHFDSLLAE